MHSYMATGTYAVKLVATANGCSDSLMKNITVTNIGSKIYIPNAFTPDGDGINDVFMIRGNGLIKVKYFRIFNRWGELIFEKQNFKPNDPSLGWDGKIKGVVGPPDVFVYTADIMCENGSSYLYKGNVSIIR